MYKTACGSCIAQAALSGASVDVRPIHKHMPGTSDVATSPGVQNSRPRLVIIVDPVLASQGHLLMLGQYTSIILLCFLFCTSGDMLVPPQVTLSSSKLTGLKVTTILLQVYNRIICNFEQLKGAVTMFCIGP